MANDLIQLPSQIVDFRPRADRSYKLTFETRQLTGEEVAILADNFQGEGWLLFKPNPEGISLKEIPTETADAGMKTPSQRLRASIMVLYREKGAKGDPEAFYRTTMQKLIEYVQSKIPRED